MNALQRAIHKAGGMSKLAKAIHPNGRAALVFNWVRRGAVPAEWCPRIEWATGVLCEELRPDIDWWVVRGHDKKAPQWRLFNSQVSRLN